MDNVDLRLATDKDYNYILKTSMLLYRKNTRHIQKIDAEVYFNQEQKALKRILNSPETVALIATTKDYPNQILGYIVSQVFENATIYHFMAVKSELRNFGIGTKLFEAIPKKETLLYTRALDTMPIQTQKIIDKYKILYNPYLA